jgi:hypothetical protein
VLIHLEASTVSRAIATIAASNFLAARIGAFEAAFCYAKITPAAQHRGESPGRCRECAEAAGGNPKFGLNDLPTIDTGSARPPPQAPRVAAS